MNSQRMDTYSSINRTIHFISDLAYGVNQTDCSLFETSGSKAHLFSRKGVCDIDLLKKTAHGSCDANAQADARVPARQPFPTESQIAAIERNGASDPAAAALAAAMRSHPPASSGERKTILGLACDIWENPFDPDSTNCLSRGGSFAAAEAAGGLTQSSMALEMMSVSGLNMHAVKAQLDTMVNAAVFAPYLAGGFQVSNTGARK